MSERPAPGQESKSGNRKGIGQLVEGKAQRLSGGRMSLVMNEEARADSWARELLEGHWRTHSGVA